MLGDFKLRFATFLATLWIRSLRIRFSAPPEYGPGIIGIWHRDLLANAAAFRGKGVHALISESSDGEIFARITEKLGYKLSRGSDTKGATNVRHLLRTLQNGGFVAMALDGPRGPALQVKPGSLWLAQRSGKPLWLVDVKYGKHLTLKTWDKFIIPLPMTSIDIRINYFIEKQEKDKHRDNITP